MTSITQADLKVDPEIPDQKWVCISFLTPVDQDIKDKKVMKLVGVKIRGCYENRDDANKRAEFLRQIEPHINIYVGDVGKWLPFVVNQGEDEKYVTEENYANNELNSIMKNYKEQRENAKMEFEKRKHELIERTMKENEIKKSAKEKKEKLSQLSKDSELSKLQNNLDSNKESIDSIKTELESNKESLSTINKESVKLESELLELQKEFEKLTGNKLA